MGGSGYRKIMDNIVLYKLAAASHPLCCASFPGALLYENAKRQRKDGEEKDRRTESGMTFTHSTIATG